MMALIIKKKKNAPNTSTVFSFMSSNIAWQRPASK